jgi:inorganic pyrophosphatase
MSALDSLPPGRNPPDDIRVIVEIPKGSQNKYEIDKESGLLRLDRVLFSPIYYPGDYGFVPRTLSTDGDPLDALVLVTYPTLPLTLIDARPIGLLDMVDGGEHDAKLLCVPVHDVRFDRIRDLSDMDEPTLNEIAHFFEVYKQLEKKKVDVKGWKGKDEAHRVIRESIARFGA